MIFFFTTTVESFFLVIHNSEQFLCFSKVYKEKSSISKFTIAEETDLMENESLCDKSKQEFVLHMKVLCFSPFLTLIYLTLIWPGFLVDV